MNKFWKFAGVIAVLVAVVAFAGVTAAFAQGPNQPGDFTPHGSSQAQNGSDTALGLMAVDEITMHTAIAEALGLSLEEFEAAIEEGKTPLILAEELGIDFAIVQAAMDSVHADALQQAVDEGLISQEQADWINSRRGGQNGQGSDMNGSLSNSRGGQNGQGSDMNGGPSSNPTGKMGRGSGSNGDYSGDCLYQTA